MATPQMLKCRFCAWQTSRFYRLKNGQVRHGHIRLEAHVEHAHREELDKIMAQVRANDASDPETLPVRERDDA